MLGVDEELNSFLEQIDGAIERCSSRNSRKIISSNVASSNENSENNDAPTFRDISSAWDSRISTVR